MTGHPLTLQAAPPTAARKPYVGTPEDAAARIGLNRRGFFRWLSIGRDKDDPLPADDPASVPAWYERMLARGVFSHRIPTKVIKVCTSSPPAPPAASGQAVSAGTITLAGATGSMGIAAEIDDVEREAAALREARDDARRANDQHAADQLTERHNAAVERLRALKRDAVKLLANDDEFIRRTWVADDLAAVIPSIIAQWLAEGPAMHRASRSPLSRAEYLTQWRECVTRVCNQLAQSKFAPPLALDAAA